jgi:outer membrane protein assembly factor BamB
MRIRSMVGLAALVLACPVAGLGADWPQWLGPDRNNVSKETGLLKKWPEGGPQLLWTYREAGTGYSAPAVVGGKVYVMGARKDDEYLFALDDQGKELWAVKIGPVYDFKTNAWSRGPNGTPSVDGDRVYALGSQGELVCASTAGKVLWHKSMPNDLGGEVNPVGGDAKFGWGFSWSPLVEKDKVVCIPGGPKGLFAALDKNTGEVLWRSKDVKDQATYASPVAAEIGGVRQYIALVQNGVVSVAPQDGALLWEHRRENDYPDVVCPTPICQGDQVFVTAWGGGSDLLKIGREGNKFKATEVYSTKRLSNRQGGVVLVDKFVYGFHDTRAWVCLDFATGEAKWEAKRLGAGSLTAADGRLYIRTEDGDTVAMAEASPKAFTEVSRFTLPETSKLRKSNGKAWTYPVISDGRLYLRDQELIFCYKIK